MDQSELFGKVIKVNAAKPPKNANEGLGSKTALWEQVRLHGIMLCDGRKWFGWSLIFRCRRAG